MHTDTKGFLSVMVALGDSDDHVVYKTLPVLPGMNADDVCEFTGDRSQITDINFLVICWSSF